MDFSSNFNYVCSLMMVDLFLRFGNRLLLTRSLGMFMSSILINCMVVVLMVDQVVCAFYGIPRLCL